MDLYLFANSIVCVFAFAALIYGATEFIKPHKALYGKMITLAMLCIVFSRLSNIVRIVTLGNLYDSFQLGFLGGIGSFLFFFSSNFGTIDTMADDGSKAYLRYRLIGLIAPAVTICVYFIVFWVGDASLLWRIQGGMLMICVAPCSYFHLKHLTLPDVDYGIIKSLRPYNFFALLYMFSSVLECVALKDQNEILTLISCILSGVFIFAMMVLTVNGLKKLGRRR